MTLLLDSHTLLWAIYAPPMLTDRVRELLADKGNELVISHAVLWEVLNKSVEANFYSPAHQSWQQWSVSTTSV